MVRETPAQCSSGSGRVVALEGLTESAIDAQLHLLPLSTHILVLPSVEQYLGKTQADKDGLAPSSLVAAPPPSFDARRFVRHVHEAAAARRDDAVAFLQDGRQNGRDWQTTAADRQPSPSSPRKIVFLNGGTAASHALCIDAIRKNDPAAGGRLDKASQLFDGIVADGVAGLDADVAAGAEADAHTDTDVVAGADVDADADKATAWHHRPLRTARADEALTKFDVDSEIADDDDDGDNDDDDDDDDDDGYNGYGFSDSDYADSSRRATHLAGQDPISKAMRAADALDRMTEALQPSTHVLDLTIGACHAAVKPRPRSLSLPIHGELLELLDAVVSVGAGIGAGGPTSNGNCRGSGSVWVRPSAAAGAAGSEIYDVTSFGFASPSSTSHASPTSTIFPACMRLEAIAAQQRPPASASASASASAAAAAAVASRSTPTPAPPPAFTFPATAATGDAPRGIILGPVPRGRARRRRPPPGQNPPPVSYHRRARSLERRRSISGGSFGSFGSFSSNSGLGLNFFLASSREASSSSQPRRLSSVSNTSSPAVALRKPSLSASPLPDVPLLPVAEALDRLASHRKGEAASRAKSQSRSRPQQQQQQQKHEPLQELTPAQPPKPCLTLDTHGAARPATHAVQRRPATYVDRGTDAAAVSALAAKAADSSMSSSVRFAPVLPLLEDLVIRFDDGATSDAAAAYARAVQRLQARGVRIVCSGDDAGRRGTDHKSAASVLPETPNSSSHGPLSSTTASASASASASALASAGSHSLKPVVAASTNDDYDPFAPQIYNARPNPSLPSQPSLPSIKTPKPPTPAHTPPLLPRGHTQADSDDGSNDHSPPFHMLTTAPYPTVLALHNALRAVLATHFPSARDDDGGMNITFGGVGNLGSLLSSYLPGMGGGNLWTPLLDGIDLVLAVGGQRGIPADVMANITGQLDVSLGGTLGAASTANIQRSGRLDIRYLLANAIQAQAAQKARSRATTALDSSRGGHLPATEAPDAQSMAALVLTQLDLYLRAHHPTPALSSSRVLRYVLLDYPLELMALVLALQQLIGHDVVQVAGVVAAAEGQEGRPAFYTARLQPAFSSSTWLLVDPQRPPLRWANFLLTSAAGRGDVAAFAAALRKRLAVKNGTSAVDDAANGIDGGSSTSMASPPPPPPHKSPRRKSPSSAESQPARPGLTSSATTTALGHGTSPPPPRHHDVARRIPSIPPTPATAVQPRSPTSSTSSQQSWRSQHSQHSHQSQAEAWHIASAKTAMSPSTSAVSTASAMSAKSAMSAMSSTTMTPPRTGLSPPPIVLPGSRLVAKTITVGASTAARRAREEVAAEAAVASSSVASPAKKNGKNGKVGGLLQGAKKITAYDDCDDDMDGTSCDEDTHVAGTGIGASAGVRASAGTVAVAVAVAVEDDDYDGIDGDDSEDDFDNDDDDFENDADMRRLMPLFMRDRAALLASKEAADRRTLLVAPVHSKSSRLTGADLDGTPVPTTAPPVRRPVEMRNPPRHPSLQNHQDHQTHQNDPHPNHLSHQTYQSYQTSQTYQAYQGHQSFQSYPSQQRSSPTSPLRSKGSRSSLHSQASHSSQSRKGNDGKKALKLLGLA